MIFTGCTGRSRSSRKARTRNATVENTSSRKRATDNKHSSGRSRNRKTVVPKDPTIIHDTVVVLVPTRPEIPQEPQIIHDTIIMVVPMPPDNQSFQQNSNDIIIPSSKKLQPVKHKHNLPNPPRIAFQKPLYLYTREQYIENFNLNKSMKDLIFACDYDNSTVRNNAVALVSLSPGQFNLGQICDIFDFCYQNWSYVNDPLSSDYFAKASETLKNGLNGDCDDFAILICSMILSIGGEARISFAYNDNDGHAFTEVNIGTTERKAVEDYLKVRYGYNGLWHKNDGENWWLNLDWQGSYPGANYWNYNRGMCFNIIRNTYQDF